MRSCSKSIILILFLCICSCSVFKEYERPDITPADNLYRGVAGRDTSTLADLQWQAFFTDPILQELIAKGLENNNDLKVAASRITQAEASLKASRLAFLPTLGFNPSFTYENAARYGGNAYGYGLQPAVSWQVDINGKLWNNKRIALSNYRQARLYEQSVRTELVSGIASCYYTLLMLDAKLEVSRTTAASWKENVRIMRAMKDAGMTNEASVSQTEANSCSIEASLCDLQSSISEAEHALSLLVGVPMDVIQRQSLKEEKLARLISTGVPAQLLSRRPDVMSAEENLVKAHYGVNLAHSAFYPSLTITGDGGFEKALTSPAGWALGVAAGLVAPILNGGRNKAGLKIAEAKKEEAVASFRQVVLKAGMEVNNAISKCRSSRDKTDIRIQQIKALEKAVDSTQKLMRDGGSTYLEVLTAQQSLLSAKLLQISDRYDSVQGMVSLYKALGGGWK